MAEVCTPFWTAHVGTKELDFCVNVDTSLTAFDPNPTLFVKQSFPLVPSLILYGDTSTGSSIVRQNIPASGITEKQFYLGQTGGFPRFTQFYLESWNSNSGPFGDKTGELTADSTGSFNFIIKEGSAQTVELNTAQPDFTIGREISLFVKSNDPSKYANVSRGTEKVVVECLIEQGGVSYINWLGLFTVFSVTNPVEVDGQTQPVQSYSIVNVESEASSSFQSNYDWKADAFLSIYPFEQGDVSDNPSFIMNTFNAKGFSESPISSNTNFNPLYHSFDSLVTPKPDKNYESVSAFTSGLVTVTPLRYLSVPYFVSELPFTDDNGNNQIAGNLTTQNPTVLSNNADDVRLGLAGLSTAIKTVTQTIT